MPQNATEKGEGETLTPQQITALQQLLAGETVSAAAKAVGVDRTTVHRWAREDFGFQAALNRGKRELAHAVQARLLAIAHKAVQTVERAVDEGSLIASLAVLKGMGALSGMPVTTGSDNPQVLRANAELAREEAELLSAEQKNSRLMRRLIVGSDFKLDTP